MTCFVTHLSITALHPRERLATSAPSVVAMGMLYRSPFTRIGPAIPSGNGTNPTMFSQQVPDNTPFYFMQFFEEFVQF